MAPRANCALLGVSPVARAAVMQTEKPCLNSGQSSIIQPSLESTWMSREERHMPNTPCRHAAGKSLTVGSRSARLNEWEPDIPDHCFRYHLMVSRVCSLPVDLWMGSG